jgi:hypothetical protein
MSFSQIIKLLEMLHYFELILNSKKDQNGLFFAGTVRDYSLYY